PNTAKWFAVADDQDGAKSDPARDERRQERERIYAHYYDKLHDSVVEPNTDFRLQLADLIGFHQREAKPQWWEFFDRQQRFEEELFDDLECLAGLELQGVPVPVKQSLAHTYWFPPQETKRRAGDGVVNVATLTNAGTIEELDEDCGHVV